MLLFVFTVTGEMLGVGRRGCPDVGERNSVIMRINLALTKIFRAQMTWSPRRHTMVSAQTCNGLRADRYRSPCRLRRKMGKKNPKSAKEIY